MILDVKCTRKLRFPLISLDDSVANVFLQEGMQSHRKKKLSHGNAMVSEMKGGHTKRKNLSSHFFERQKATELP